MFEMGRAALAKRDRLTSGVLDFLRGIAFGISTIVPGMSTGTIAIILGFYNRLLAAINNLHKTPMKSLGFLLPLGVGAVFGLLLFSGLVSWLLANVPFPTMLFFIGMIAGIVPIIYQKIRAKTATGRGGSFWRPGWKTSLMIVAPIILLVVITHIRPEMTTDPAEMMANIHLPMMIFIMMAGILGAAALIVPGTSGSFVLLLMGIYPLATYALSQLGVWLRSPSDFALLAEILRVLLPLGIGIILGGLSMARAVGYLLEQHTHAVYSVILGLIIGSIYALFGESILYQNPLSPLVIAAGVMMLGVGVAMSFKLGQKKI
jgi:putative membrane protein